MSSRDVDVLVGGQGLAGTLLALALIERGASVKIVDSGAPSATEAALGILNPLLGVNVRPVDDAPRTYPIARLRYRRLEAVLGARFFEDAEMVRVFRNEEQRIRVETGNDGCPRGAWISGWYRAGETDGSIRFPFGGCSVRGAGRVDARTLLSAARAHFRALDVLIHAGDLFETAIVDSVAVRFRQYTAKTIVYCSGNDLVGRPLFAPVPLGAVRGETMVIETPAASQWGTRIVVGAVNALPAPEAGCLLVGSTYDHASGSEPAGRNAPTEAGLRYLSSCFAEISNAPFRVIRSDAGVRCTVSDRRPIVGRVPGRPRVAVFGGLGSRGFSLAPLYAEQLADLLLGTSNGAEIDADVDVNRFDFGVSPTD